MPEVLHTNLFACFLYDSWLDFLVALYFQIFLFLFGPLVNSVLLHRALHDSFVPLLQRPLGEVTPFSNN